jgi:hypothetical protein
MVSIGHSAGGQRGAAVLSSRAAMVLSSVVLFTTLAVNALNATGVAARSTTTGVGGGPITQWHARGIGGGGAFFNVAFHPTDPRLIMLTTDMGQCETSH